MSAYTDLFRSLAKQDLRFVVVGGVAVVLHGYQRLTNDVDLVIDLEPEHALRFVRALTARGMRSLLPVDAEDFADREIRESWVTERNLEVFSLHDPANPLMVVDLFAKPPIEFDVLWKHAVRETIGDSQIRIAALDDLVKMKELAGRPKDLEDIRQLLRIQERGRRT
jgi:hypothetical protein